MGDISGPGSGVNANGQPWWFPPEFEVDPELLEESQKTQERIRELVRDRDGEQGGSGEPGGP